MLQFLYPSSLRLEGNLYYLSLRLEGNQLSYDHHICYTAQTHFHNMYLGNHGVKWHHEVQGLSEVQSTNNVFFVLFNYTIKFLFIIWVQIILVLVQCVAFISDTPLDQNHKVNVNGQLRWSYTSQWHGEQPVFGPGVTVWVFFCPHSYGLNLSEFILALTTKPTEKWESLMIDQSS